MICADDFKSFECLRAFAHSHGSLPVRFSVLLLFNRHCQIEEEKKFLLRFGNPALDSSHADKQGLH